MGQLLQILKDFSPNKQGETACAGKLNYNYLLRPCSDSLIPIWIGMDCGLIHIKIIMIHLKFFIHLKSV
jgi:hypothetical protein